MFHKNKSITALIIIPMLFIVTGFLTIYGVYSHYKQKDRLTNEMLSMSNSLADQMAGSFSLAVWSFDEEQITQLLESSIKRNEISAIELSLEGIQEPYKIISKNNNGNHYFSGKYNHTENDYPVERNLLHSNDNIGLIRIYFTKEFVNNELKDNIYFIVINIFITDLSIIIVLYLMLWALIIRPLRSVDKYADSLTSGTTNSMLDKNSNIPYEIAHLQLSLEKMFGMLNEKIDSLEISKAELRKSEDRYIKVFKSTPAGIIVSDIETAEIYDLNEGAEQLFGYSSNELIGLSAFDVNIWCNPIDRQRIVKSINSNECFSNHEIQMRSKDGKVLTIQYSGNIIDIDDKKYLLSVFWDVTEQKMAEIALQKSEERFRSLVTATSHVVWRTNSTGEAIDDLPAWRQFTGQTIEEMMGTGWMKALHPEDREYIVREYISFGAKAANPDLRTRIKRSDGEYRICSIKGVPVYDGQGVVSEWVGTCIDITEQLLSEEALKQSEEKFSKAFYASPDIIVISTLNEDKIIDLNHSARKMLGYERNELIGKTVSELRIWADPTVREKIFPEFVANGYIRELEADLRTKTGEIRNTILSAELIEIQGNKCILTVIRDVTEKIKMEARLRESEELHRKLVTTVPDIIIRTDIYGNIIFINESGEETFLFNDKDSILGHNILEFVVEEDQKRARENFTLRYEEILGLKEYRLKSTNGKEWMCEINGNILYDTEKKPYGSVYVVRDITQRKEAEKALAAKVGEIERFNKIAVDRELRILELKRQISPESHKEITELQPVRQLAIQSEHLSLSSLIDQEQMQALFDSYCDAIGIASAIIDLKGNVFVAARWQQVCTDFHRRNDLTCARCIKSDIVLASDLKAGEECTIYTCENGLTDAASPIIINGNHVANVFIGQFFLAPPDFEFFKKQAKDFGFDEYDYIKAIKQVPIISETKIPAILRFMVNCANTIALLSMERILLHQSTDELRRQQLAALSLAEDANDARNKAETAQASLFLSQERLQLATRAAQIGIWDWDVSKDILVWNDNMYRLYSMSPEDFTGSYESWANSVFAEDKERADQEIKAALRGERDEPTIFRIIWGDGTIHYIESASQVFRNDKGAPIRMIGVNIDITTRKLIEDSLRNSERKYRLLFENMTSAFAVHEMIYDVNGRPYDYRYLEANPAFEKLTSISISQIIGKTVRELLPEVEEYWVQVFGKVAMTGIPTTYINYSKPLGKHFASYVFSPEINKFAVVFNDITERVAAEEALKASEQNYREIFNSTSDALFIHDKNGQIIDVNDQMCALFGYNYEEVKNLTLNDLSKGESPYSQGEAEVHVSKAVTEGQHVFEWHAKRKDGTLFWAEVALKSCEIGQQKRVIASVRDITDRKESEQELNKYRFHLEEIIRERTEELETLNERLKAEIIKQIESEKIVLSALEKEKDLSEMKTKFISITSHEFRTPLTAVYSSIQLLEKYGREMELAQFQKHVDRVKKSVKYLIQLLDDILTISRADTGKIRFDPVPLDLKNLCTRIAEDIKLQMPPEIEMQFKYLCRRNKFILDEKLLTHILTNLLSNAVKYSGNGKEIIFEIDCDNEKLTFNVSDKGIGIPLKDQEHLFQPFSRAGNVSTIPGSGLGLSIVKRSVDMHGGEIRFVSVPEKGTLFCVTIPTTNLQKKI